MKTALVTGSSGFVGRHMVAELVARGWSVVQSDLVGPRAGLDCRSVFGLHQTVYDLVVHAAARSPHRAAIDGQPGMFPYNVMLDSSLFDWAIRTGQRHVLYLSSSATYPIGMQAGHVPYRMHESDAFTDQPASADLLAAMGSMAPLCPDASYGWTKLLGEQMAAAAWAAGVPVTVVRPFSGYGEDQGTDWPFGAFVARARRLRELYATTTDTEQVPPFEIWGDGGQVRDWIHIDDVVAGALAVVGSGADEPVNLCTGIGTSMFDLACLMCDQAGIPRRLAFRDDRPAGVAYRVGDPTRLHRYYTPQVSIEEGVKRALAGG